MTKRTARRTPSDAEHSVPYRSKAFPDTPVRADVCAGCRCLIVDETIKGDITMTKSFRADRRKLAVGLKNGCRNCAVVLDAITVMARGESPGKTLWFSIEPHVRSVSIACHDGSIDGPSYMELVRWTNHPRMSEPDRPWAWNVREVRPLSDNMSSQETLGLIKDWATHCVEHHEHCLERLAGSLPKRILEITGNRVCLREQLGGSAPYVCLSHCWGPDGLAIKLTASTVGLLHEGYAASDLPKTFRDAVDVCRHLGIHYLWIDALCILQDSQADWKEAAATMAGIYENAHMTIAATSAQDSNGGLFSPIRPVMRRLDKHPHLYVREDPPHFPTLTLYPAEQTLWPLLTRAWVYQERKLSPRTIHFGRYQVYWECQTGFFSEDADNDSIWDTDADRGRGPVSLRWGDRVVDCARQWQKILTEYTNLRLTYESDRLPAIAALADQMSRLRRADDVYIAGMWKNSILSDLLWSAGSDEPRPVRLVPTWSWASTQNAKITWSAYTSPDWAKVINLEYTAIGAAYLGEVINASIVLSTSVLDLNEAKLLFLAYKEYLYLQPRFNDIFTSPSMDLFQRNKLVPGFISFDNDYYLSTADPTYVTRHAVKLLVSNHKGSGIDGIVIRQITTNPVEYERIGFLNIEIRRSEPRESYESSEYIEGEYEKQKEDLEKRMDNLIRSLPVEDVKIV